MICIKCVEKNNSQECGCRIYHNITNDLDDFESMMSYSGRVSYSIRFYSLQVNASVEDPSNKNTASHDSTNSQPNFTEVSLNWCSAELTSDTENECATSGGQSGAPRGLIVQAFTLPVDEVEEANRLIDQILDPQKVLGDLTSRMDSAWKFPLSGFLKNTLLN